MSTPIFSGLKKHYEKDYASFHTPGHKSADFFPKDLLKYDLTELPDTDALYEADGIILQAEKQLAALFGAKRTLISAGGCTLAIQTMLRLASRQSRKIIFARNSHRSAVNACALLGIEPVWLMPKEKNGFSGTVLPQDVEKCLSETPDIKACYLTSPNYYGEIADIRQIADICHAHGALLTVDNAHGSHLAFLSENLHPIALGADMSACSMHKTLPVLTGGAVLNIGNESLIEGAKEAMSLFGSTSPSYPVMASIDLCREYLENGGTEAYRRTEKRIADIKKTAGLHGLRQPSGKCDPLRVCINTACAGISGVDKQIGFFHSYGVEPEFCDGQNSVFICTPFNSESNFYRLETAISALHGYDKEQHPASSYVAGLPDAVLSPREALLSETELVPLENAVGRIAADSACPCPPGIPVVMPGECISRDVVSILQADGQKYIRCVVM